MSGRTGTDPDTDATLDTDTVTVPNTATRPDPAPTSPRNSVRPHAHRML